MKYSRLRTIFEIPVRWVINKLFAGQWLSFSWFSFSKTFFSIHFMDKKLTKILVGDFRRNQTSFLYRTQCVPPVRYNFEVPLFCLLTVFHVSSCVFPTLFSTSFSLMFDVAWLFLLNLITISISVINAWHCVALWSNVFYYQLFLSLSYLCDFGWRCFKP